MEYTGYKKILDDALVDYVNSGGSVFYMGSVIKEYIFDYDEGIRLKQCIWHVKGKDR